MSEYEVNMSEIPDKPVEKKKGMSRKTLAGIGIVVMLCIGFFAYLGFSDNPALNVEKNEITENEQQETQANIDMTENQLLYEEIELDSNHAWEKEVEIAEYRWVEVLLDFDNEVNFNMYDKNGGIIESVKMGPKLYEKNWSRRMWTDEEKQVYTIKIINGNNLSRGTIIVTELGSRSG